MTRKNNSYNIKNNKKAKKEIKSFKNFTGFEILKKYRNGNDYSGGIKNNKRHGWGIMTFSFLKNRFEDFDSKTDYPYQYNNHKIYPYAWVIYSGEWKRGEPCGEGKLIFPDDSYCKGFWKNGYITDVEYKYIDGRKYIGQIAKMHYRDLCHITPFRLGFGTLYRQDGSKKFEGIWKSIPCYFSLSTIFNNENDNDYYFNEDLKEFGDPDGQGIFYSMSGKELSGEWKGGILGFEDKMIIYNDKCIQEITMRFVDDNPPVLIYDNNYF